MGASDTTSGGPGVPSRTRGIPDRTVDSHVQAPSAAVARTLRDGRRVCLRAPCAGDMDQVKECFQRLSPDSRRLRFFIAKRVLTDAELDFFTLADGQDHIAVAALELGVDGREARIHGMARCIRAQEGSSRGELAVAVADDVQGLGVGRLLIEELGRAARTQGIERFVIETLSDNVGLCALAARLGGAVLSREVGSVHYELPTALAGAPRRLQPRPAIRRAEQCTRGISRCLGTGPARRIAPSASAIASPRYSGNGLGELGTGDMPRRDLDGLACALRSAPIAGHRHEWTCGSQVGPERSPGSLV